MDLQFERELEPTTTVKNNLELENEYQIKIEVENISFAENLSTNMEIKFIFGDLVKKLMKSGEENQKEISFVVHSIPSLLAEKLLNVPIFCQIISLDDKKILCELNLTFFRCNFC
jgi:hypothetical protein